MTPETKAKWAAVEAALHLNADMTSDIDLIESGKVALSDLQREAESWSRLAELIVEADAEIATLKNLISEAGGWLNEPAMLTLACVDKRLRDLRARLASVSTQGEEKPWHEGRPHRVKCWKCGMATRSDSDHCQYCGVRIEDTNDDTGSTREPQPLPTEPRPENSTAEEWLAKFCAMPEEQRRRFVDGFNALTPEQIRHTAEKASEPRPEGDSGKMKTKVYGGWLHVGNHPLATCHGQARVIVRARSRAAVRRALVDAGHTNVTDGFLRDYWSETANDMELRATEGLEGVPLITNGLKHDGTMLVTTRLKKESSHGS